MSSNVWPQNCTVGRAFEGRCLECCGLGLAGQVLALALADAVKLRYINSNIEQSH